MLVTCWWLGLSGCAGLVVREPSLPFPATVLLLDIAERYEVLITLGDGRVPAGCAVLSRLGGWRPGVRSWLPGWKRRSRRLLETTNTELNAIAAAAISGLRNPSAASGMAAVL